MTLIEAVKSWTAGKRLRRAGASQSHSLFSVLECCDQTSQHAAFLDRADMLARDWQVVDADGATPGRRAPQIRHARAQVAVPARGSRVRRATSDRSTRHRASATTHQQRSRR